MGFLGVMKGEPQPAMRMDRIGTTGHSDQENGVESRLSVQTALFRQESVALLAV